jgi:glycosyltransferase involved in cell wall biosynthesis
MTVSVVIPSIGRPSLEFAAKSALRQPGVEVEVVVVDSSGSGAARPYLGADVTYVETGERLSAGAARSLGCERGSGEWIAFLDDDDICLPSRFRSQVDLASARSHETPLVSADYVSGPYDAVLAFAAKHGIDDPGDFAATAIASFKRGPRRRPAAQEGVVDYLLRRRTFRNRTRIHTSTVLTDGSFARSVPWNTTITRFEDWDWFVKAELAGARLVHIAEPLVIVSDSSPRSISDLRHVGSRVSDIAWPIPILYPGRRRELGDLLLCDVAVKLLKEQRLDEAIRSWRVSHLLGAPGPQARARFAFALLAYGLGAPARRLKRTGANG